MSDNGSDGQGDKDIVADRQFYVSVNRTGGSGAPVMDYLRLGTPSDDAMFDHRRSVESHARRAITRGGILLEIEEKIGADGKLAFTSGSRTETITGNSFTRVAGKAFEIYREKHEVQSSANAVSGTSGNYKYSLSKAGDIGLFEGPWSEQKLRPHVEIEQIEFDAATAFKFAYDAGTSYTAKTASTIESIGGKLRLKISLTGLELAGPLGTVSIGVSPEFEKLRLAAEFKTTWGNLNHSGEPLHFGEESITLGLDDDPIHEKMREIFIGITAIVNVIDKIYQKNMSNALDDIDKIKRNPDAVQEYADFAKIIAIIGGSVGLAAYAVSMIGAGLQWKKAKGLKENIEGKPHFRIDRTAPTGGRNRITLDTGEGASIELTGNTVSLRAATINLETNFAAPPYELGAININAGTDLNLTANQNAQWSAVGTATVRGNQGIALNAPGQDITSNATQWVHNGAFQAGTTTLGPTTAASLNVNGAPVAIAPVPALVQAQFQNLPERIQALVAPLAAVSFAAAISSLLG